MDEQDKAIIETSKKFLDRFNCAFECIEDPLETLQEFFEFYDDWEYISVSIKTPMGNFSHWYIIEIGMDNIESLVKWLKKYTENILRLDFWLNV